MSTYTNTSFEYLPGDSGKYITLASDIPAKMTELERNILDFQVIFEQMGWARGELERLARELEDMSRYFGGQQGLDPNGNLLRQTKATVVGNSIDFRNEVTNERGQFYAGHIEYGHYARDGKTFVEARPFMRPALYAVARASSGNFRDILSELLLGAFSSNGLGYQGISNLQFGHKLGAAYHYKKPSSFVRQGMMAKSRINPEEYSLQAGFIKKTGDSFSLKRGSKNAHQEKLRRDSKLNSKGRNTYRESRKGIGSQSKVRVIRALTSKEKKAIRTKKLEKVRKIWDRERKDKLKTKEKLKKKRKQQKQVQKARKNSKPKKGKKQVHNIKRTEEKSLSKAQKARGKFNRNNSQYYHTKVEKKVSETKSKQKQKNKKPKTKKEKSTKEQKNIVKKIDGVKIPKGEKQIKVKVATDEFQYKEYGWGYDRAMYPSILKEKYALDKNNVYVPIEWSSSSNKEKANNMKKKSYLRDEYGTYDAHGGY